MDNYEFNTPNIQGVTSPLSNMSNNSNVGQVQHTPVVSYVVPSNISPTRVVSSPNVVTNLIGFNQSPTNGQHNEQQTREISTVYLPPLRYRYDNTTGTLVQVSGNTPVNQVQSPMGTAPPNFNQFNPFGSFSPTMGQQDNPLSQKVNLLNQNMQNTFLNHNVNGYNKPQTPRNQGLQYTNFNNPNFQQSVGQQQQQFVNTQFVNKSFVNPPVFVNSSGVYGTNPGYEKQQFRNLSTGFTNQGQWNQGLQPNFTTNTNPTQNNFQPNTNYNNLPTFGYQQSYMNPNNNGNFHNYNNHLYMDTPRARYESAVKEYYDRMNGNFQNYNPNLDESPNGFVQAFSTFENAASKFFSGTDSFVTDFKNAAFKMFNPNSADYLKAVVFKLQRLENIPVNTNIVSKLCFNVVGYFDTNTENYDIYKSEKQWALPTTTSGLVDCDLKGETLKVPWKGEEFVFLKIVENIDKNRFVLGRIQLKLDTLVTGHPLKVTIIGDDGNKKGSAILEFAVGAISLDEFKQMNMETYRNEIYKKNYENKSKNNIMPDYDIMLEEKNKFENNINNWPQTKLKFKQGYENIEKCHLKKPLKNLVSWCCDITDQDLM